ncbi:hypothetical protein U9M48_022238 [Paspalum notatum var. saurae]|uniref:Uncharacterized protein n=1 Tax=Paspalum notatum var. saurae TaxID=547442 RepID=A0AAQ3TKP4_PASNO
MAGARGGERWRSSTDGRRRCRPSRLLHRQSRIHLTPRSFAPKHIQACANPAVSCATADLGASSRRRRRSTSVQTHLFCSIAGSHLIFVMISCIHLVKQKRANDSISCAFRRPSKW